MRFLHYFDFNQVGPFVANIPCEVPLWMCVYLVGLHKCHVIPPSWMTVERLLEARDAENGSPNCAPFLHLHYMEIVSVLLDHAPMEIPRSDEKNIYLAFTIQK